ncbi:transporter [Bradyrhizobium sp. INPA03-11B]|uniref:SphA family protein n=1 Tax=Bradyrhizobium sp. INPA03-11B TaxID=418598 RepID=UPI00338E8751
MKRGTTLALAVTTSLSLFSALAWGDESIRPAGPIGGTDIRQAELPPPGVYGVGVGMGLDFPTFWGANQDFDAQGRSGALGTGLVVVYSAQVLGGSIGSSIFASAGRTCFGFQPGPKSCSEGLGDLYSDVFVWSRYFPSGVPASPNNPLIRYGLNVMFGLGINFPTGAYNSAQLVNLGGNMYDIAPNVALTYTAPSILGPGLGDATEFSARVFFNNYTKNHATDYQSGNVVSADFAITQRVNQWQFGLTGTSYLQIEDDLVAGVTAPNGGNRAVGLFLGPIVSYDFLAADRPWNVTLKGLFAVTGQNAVAANGLVLRVATKLF